jgi:hypothetical protein
MSKLFFTNDQDVKLTGARVTGKLANNPCRIKMRSPEMSELGRSTDHKERGEGRNTCSRGDKITADFVFAQGVLIICF